MNKIIIVGGGIAGLTAARELALGGTEVAILEARPRLGGRIATVGCECDSVVELGAEFIHGEQNEVWDMLALNRLRASPILDRHWRFEKGALVEDLHFWKRIDGVFGRIDPEKEEPFRRFLQRRRQLNATSKSMVADYVEGFFAADQNRISTKSLTSDDSHKAFRIEDGYKALVKWFASELSSRKVAIHLETTAKRILWKRGRAEIHALTEGVSRIFRAGKVILTLPPSVLRSSGAGAVEFQPNLPKLTQQALAKVPVGNIVKIILTFRTRFWPVGRFGFIHASEAFLPTWWCVDERKSWVGWLGGPRADRLHECSEPVIFSRAIAALSQFFGVAERYVEANCVGRFYHGWAADPFSCGAYSYLAVGAVSAPQQLAKPVAGTLFFAGEATAPRGKEGTVHGAIASGRRVARQIARSCHRD